MSITVEQAINDLKDDKMVNTENEGDTIAALIVYGMMFHGGSRQKVRDWILDSRKFSKESFFGHFKKYWANLEKSNVIKDGKVYVSVLPEEENFGIEFAMLINVALGYVARVEKDE
ncbi:MAG: hypothetical protein ACYSYL_21805 [Planctomycetota bacterium]